MWVDAWGGSLTVAGMKSGKLCGWFAQCACTNLRSWNWYAIRVPTRIGFLHAGQNVSNRALLMLVSDQ